MRIDKNSNLRSKRLIKEKDNFQSIFEDKEKTSQRSKIMP